MADWERAPRWARSWAVDEKGQAFWFGGVPVVAEGPDSSGGFWSLAGYATVAFSDQPAPEGVPWRETLELRPGVRQ